MSFLLPQRNQSTFKPRKRPRGGPSGSGGTEVVDFASKSHHQTLGSGSLRDAVKLPDGEDVHEWIAVNIVDFFNQISMLYGTVVEQCTAASCPKMTAGPRFEYLWSEPNRDGSSVRGAKTHKCSAPQYIDYLMTWVQLQLDDETLFPSKIGVPFPAQFGQVSRTVMKRLFRIYAHIYHHHFVHVELLKEEPHLNTSFKHFMLFVNEFQLIERRELEPLRELIDSLISTTTITAARGAEGAVA